MNDQSTMKPKQVKLVRDLQGKSRGYAFIEYKESRHLKGKIFW